MAKIDNLVKLIERKNPFLDELANAVAGLEWVYTKDLDTFNKKGDVLDFIGFDGVGTDITDYLVGHSTNPRIKGTDQWQLYWVVEKIMDGTLVPYDFDDQEEAKIMVKEIIDAYNDYEEFEDRYEDDDEEFEDTDESIVVKRKSLNNQSSESLDNRNIVNDIYDILLGNNKNTLVDNIDNQEVNLDTSTITFDAYGKKIEIIIKIKDIK